MDCGRTDVPALSNAGKVGIDIGGSLVKIVVRNKAKEDPLEFFEFPTKHVEDLLDVLAKLNERIEIAVTGGGAHKLRRGLEKIGARHSVIYVDEMDALSCGAQHLLPSSLLKFDPSSNSLSPAVWAAQQKMILANVGTGVSFMRIMSGASERIAGSPIGGGTLLGMMRHIYGPALDFDSVVEDCKRGDNKNFDMTVGDIYGGGYPGQALLGKDVIAGCFAKPLPLPSPSLSPNSRREDFAASLLNMILCHLTQVAILTCGIEGCETIIFVGGFFRSDFLMQATGRLMGYWSKTVSVYFLSNASYTGCIGALQIMQNASL